MALSAMPWSMVQKDVRRGIIERDRKMAELENHLTATNKRIDESAPQPVVRRQKNTKE
ncbi:MAG TPA: hypothetical protein VGJ22_03545 [Anaerolineales bacterium]